jgi:molybdopterin-binding protein
LGLTEIVPTAFPPKTAIRSLDPMLSARNQFPGTVKSITLGNVMAEVVVAVGDLEVVSAITRGSVEQMGIKVGDRVVAVIKSTEVMIQKD